MEERYAGLPRFHKIALPVLLAFLLMRGIRTGTRAGTGTAVPAFLVHLPRLRINDKPGAHISTSTLLLPF